MEGHPYFTRSGQKQEQMAKYLLQNKANPNHSPDDAETPLLWASKHSELALVKLLLEYGADINIYGEDGLTSLAISVAKEDKELFDYLLEKKADPNIVLGECDTALIISVTISDSMFFDMLIYCGALPDLKGIGENTALHIASNINNSYAVSTLIDKGAEIKAKNWKEMTPLDFAIYACNLECAFLLIKQYDISEIEQIYSGEKDYFLGVALKLKADTLDKNSAKDLYVKSDQILEKLIKDYESNIKEFKGNIKTTKTLNMIGQVLAEAFYSSLMEMQQRVNAKQLNDALALSKAKTPSQYCLFRQRLRDDIIYTHGSKYSTSGGYTTSDKDPTIRAIYKKIGTLEFRKDACIQLRNDIAKALAL